MLVFGMKDTDYVVIDENIVVRVKWEGNDVKLCIDAPRDVVVERDKNYEQRCMLEGIEPRWKFDKLIKNKRKRRTVLPTMQAESKI